MTTAELFIDSRCELGEGPFWHPLQERLFWFDILNKTLFSATAGGIMVALLTTVLGLVGKSSDPIGELRWLHQRAAQWPDGRLADRLARELLPRLLGKRSTGEALDLVRERLRKNPRFRPASSAAAASR